jgi:hypothetical protein
MAYRSLARGQEHVKACSGLHTEGGPSGKGVFETRVALREAFFGNTSEAKRSAMKPLRLPGTGRCSLARPLRPPSRGILPGHKRSRMIWKRTIPRTQPSGSITCHRFARFSLRTIVSVQRRQNCCKPQCRMSWANRAAQSMGSSGPSIRFMCVATRIWLYIKGAQPAGEFQKILDHCGAVLFDPISMLAHLQLGRAYALSGDKPRQNPPIRISSPSGKMLIRIFQS